MAVAIASISRAMQNSQPTARPTPAQRGFSSASPLATTHMGPPWGEPLASILRYSMDRVTSVSLRAMPTRPTIHIQKIAPGPPRARAMATPPMLPSPTVADSAAARA